MVPAPAAALVNQNNCPSFASFQWCSVRLFRAQHGIQKLKTHHPQHEELCCGWKHHECKNTPELFLVLFTGSDPHLLHTLNFWQSWVQQTTQHASIGFQGRVPTKIPSREDFAPSSQAHWSHQPTEDPSSTVVLDSPHKPQEPPTIPAISSAK